MGSLRASAARQGTSCVPILICIRSAALPSCFCCKVYQQLVDEGVITPIASGFSSSHSSAHLPLSKCSKVYQQLVDEGVITPAPEFKPPEVPLDLDYAKKAGKVGFCC